VKNRLYVGGLPWATTDQELKALFEEAKGATTVEEGLGQESVKEVNIIPDRETGKSRGFAFVTFASEEQAQQAIKLFHGIQYGERTLMVSDAKEQPQRSSSFGGGGNRGSNGRSSGGGYNSGNRNGSSTGRGYNSDKKDWR